MVLNHDSINSLHQIKCVFDQASETTNLLKKQMPRASPGYVCTFFTQILCDRMPNRWCHLMFS